MRVPYLKGVVPVMILNRLLVIGKELVLATRSDITDMVTKVLDPDACMAYVEPAQARAQRRPSEVTLYRAGKVPYLRVVYTTTTEH